MGHNSSLITSTEFIPRLVYLLFVVVATIFGNLLVIIAVARFKKLRRSTNLILASLAVADLMSGIVTVPLYILWTVNPEVFDKSAFLCRLVLLSCLLLVAASQVSLLVLSFERYLAVCQPFQHRSLLLHCPWIHKVAIFCIWLISGITTAASSLAIRSDYLTCSYYGVFDKMFLFLAVIFGIFVMFLAIIVINIKVLCSVRDHEKRLSVVDISTFGDHRNSSYLCHQDALECHNGPAVIVETTGLAVLPLSISSTKDNAEDGPTQSLLENENDEHRNGGVEDEEDTLENDIQIKSSIFNTRDSSTSAEANLNKSPGSTGLTSRNKSLKVKIAPENNIICGSNSCLHRTLINADKCGSDLEGSCSETEDGECFSPQNEDKGMETIENPFSLGCRKIVRKSFQDNLESFSNDLNSPKLHNKDIESINCLIDGERSVQNASLLSSSSGCNGDITSVENSLSPRSNFDADMNSVGKSLVESDDKSVLKYSQPSSQVFDPLLQMYLHSSEKTIDSKSDSTLSTTCKINNPLNSEDSTMSYTEDDFKIKFAKPVHCLTENNNGTSNRRTRKHCKISHLENVHIVKGWKENEELNQNKGCVRSEISFGSVIKSHDLILSLPLSVCPVFNIGMFPNQSSNCCRSLQFLHLETESLLDPSTNIAYGGQNDDKQNKKSLYRGSLQNIKYVHLSNESEMPLTTCENVDGGSDEDETITTNDSNCLDKTPLICNTTSSSRLFKQKASKHSPKRHHKVQKRLKTQQKLHHSLHEISTCSSEKESSPIFANSHTNILHSVPDLTSPVLLQGGESVPEVLTTQNSNPLPPVPFPIYSSCPGFCTTSTPPQINFSSSIPSLNTIEPHDNDDVFEPVVPFSVSLYKDGLNCSQTENDDKEAIHPSNYSLAHQKRGNSATEEQLKNNNSISYDNPNNEERIIQHALQHEKQNGFHGSHHSQERNVYIKNKSKRHKSSTVSNCSSISNNHSQYKHPANTSNRSSISNNNTNIQYSTSDAKRKSSCVANQRHAYISKKVARTVTLVCASFILAWLPFFVVIIYNTFCARCNLDYALNAVLMVAFGQSACNPVIYALYHASFRRAYESLLIQMCSKAGSIFRCPYTLTSLCAREQNESFGTE